MDNLLHYAAQSVWDRDHDMETWLDEHMANSAQDDELYAWDVRYYDLWRRLTWAMRRVLASDPLEDFDDGADNPRATYADWQARQQPAAPPAEESGQ